GCATGAGGGAAFFRRPGFCRDRRACGAVGTHGGARLARGARAAAPAHGPGAVSLDEIALLRGALELPESERRAFVERRCADDPARRARLLDLVALDAEGDTLLDGGVDAL